MFADSTIARELTSLSAKDVYLLTEETARADWTEIGTNLESFVISLFTLFNICRDDSRAVSRICFDCIFSVCFGYDYTLKKAHRNCI